MRKVEWVLGGFISILLLATVAYVAWWYWLAPMPSSSQHSDVRTQLAARPAATPVVSGSTALAGFPLAETVALNWSSDAVLVSASATWPVGSDFSQGKAPWSYTFYAPELGKASLVTVAEGKATLVSESRTDNPGTAIASAATWQVDSQKAVESLRQFGGDDFVAEHGQATAILTLAPGAPLRWEAVLFANGSGQSMNVMISAEDGSILRSG